VRVTQNPNIIKRMMITAGEFGNIMCFGGAVFAASKSASSHILIYMTVKFFMLLGKKVFQQKS